MAKDSIHFAVTPTVRERLIAIATHGMREGADFTRHGKASRSALIRYTVDVAFMACAAPVAVVPALPAATAPTDTERLRAAMTRQGLTNATLGALLGVSRDVVKNAVRGLAMGPKLRTWLDGQEGGGR